MAEEQVTSEAAMAAQLEEDGGCGDWGENNLDQRKPQQGTVLRVFYDQLRFAENMCDSSICRCPCSLTLDKC